MTRVLLLSLCLSCLPYSLIAEEKDCADTESPRAEQTCRERLLMKAEAELKAGYRQLDARLDQASRESLRESHQAWLAHRRGSVETLRHTLVNQRIRELEIYARQLEQLRERKPPELPVPPVIASRAANPPPPAGEDEPADAGEQWAVQVGSFRDEQRAEKMLQSLAKQEWRAEIVKNGKWFAVRLQPAFPTREQAMAQRKKYENQSGDQAMLVRHRGGAAPGANRETVLGLVFAEAAGEDGLQARLFPLARLRDGEYAATGADSLAGEIQDFNLFDRGNRVGAFQLSSVPGHHLGCEQMVVAAGDSNLGADYLEALREEGLPGASVLLALNQGAAANATQDQARPLGLEYLALDAAQERALLEHIAKRFMAREKKLPKGHELLKPVEINLHTVNVYDLNADGQVEYLAVAGAPVRNAEGKEEIASLLVWVELQADRVTPVFDMFAPPRPEAADSVAYTLVGIMDLNADSLPEMLLRVDGKKGSEFRIYEYRDSGFKQVFSSARLDCVAG